VPLYHWSARFSVYTGLPTVIGWDNHQRQQRGKFSSLVDRRQEDVGKFYNDPSPAEALPILQKYRVSYVIVGQIERLYYDPAGLAKFDTSLNGSLELVYENPGTKVYRVKDELLPEFLTAAGASDLR